MGFQKATKKQAKLRLAVFGPSGAGKTFTSLRIAQGIGGKVAVIDSEEKTACKYADRFVFDVCDLEKKTITEYVKWIKEASELGYTVLIIDSLSHAWQELLEEVDQLAKTKYKGNTWSAWNEGTPKQKEFIGAILKCNCHVIATMRSKTEWATEQGNGGKSKPVRVGLAPEQGKGIEYEFDMLMEISTDHIANIIKDRTGKFQDELIPKPGEEFGKQLREWLETGEAPTAIPSTPGQSSKAEQKNDTKSTTDKQDEKFAAKLKAFNTAGSKLYGTEWDKKRGEIVLAKTKKRKDGTSTSSSKECTIEELESLTKSLQKKLDEKEKQEAQDKAIAEQHKKQAEQDASKGGHKRTPAEEAIYTEVRNKIFATDNGIDFMKVLNEQQPLIEMIKDEQMSAALIAFINSKATKLGVNLKAA